jgi:uncharacterized membrane protein YkoI
MHRKLALGVGIAAAAVIATGGIALAAEDHSHPATAGAYGGDHHDDAPGRDDHGTAATATPANTKISLERAGEIARGAVPGATITSIEIEDEHGTAAWEVELTPANGPHRELTIDAGTGKIIENEIDRPSAHDDDED